MENILEVFFGAFKCVFDNKKALIKALLIPFTFLILISIWSMNNYVNPQTSLDGFKQNILVTFVLLFLEFLLHVSIAISTHRIILMGEESVPEWGKLSIGNNELRFIWYSILVVVIMIPTALLSFIPTIGLPLAFVGIAYLAGRVSLILPATATEQDWNISDAWDKSRNHQLLMSLTVVIFPIIFGIPELLLSYLPYMEIPVIIISIFTTVLVVAALSVVFKLITDEEDDEYQKIPLNPYK